MNFNEFKELLFKKAELAGFIDYEIFYSENESLSINVYQKEVEKYKLNNSFGLSFRGLFDGKMGQSYTEILDEKAVDMLIKNAKDAAKAIENDDVNYIYEGDSKYEKVNTYTEGLDNISPDNYIKLAMEMEEECKKQCSSVVNFSSCSVSYGKGEYGIINSKGLNLKNKTNTLMAYVIPIIENQNQKYDGMGYKIAYKLSDIKPKDIAKEAIEEALKRIGGKSIKSGKYKVIINNEAMVSLISTFSSIFNSESVQKGLSLLKDKEGTKIAADIVTLIDDPLMEKGLATCAFDDEGVATFKKNIIKDGVLETLFYNLKTANKAGVKSTGNGFKSSYASTVGVSETNLYIKPGKDDIGKLCEKVKDGVMITEFAGLHSGANSVTGDFSLAAKGFMIEDGKKTFPVEQITVAGNFFDLLKEIEEIGSDLKFPMSSIGSPSVIIKELSIAGK